MGSKPKSTDFLQDVFSQVPETYEKINHILTLNFDKRWRKKAAKLASESGGKEIWVDMCTGTGETAVYLTHLASKDTKVIAIDFSEEMMGFARKKEEAKNIEFIRSDVKSLPFKENSIDQITISFATRNINLNRDTLTNTFNEFYRVLKPGGSFINLETSQPPAFILRKLFHWYIKLFVKRIGARISNSQVAYAYLSKTIPRFYPAQTLSEIMYKAGFETVKYKHLLFGVAAIHQATKQPNNPITRQPDNS